MFIGVLCLPCQDSGSLIAFCSVLCAICRGLRGGKGVWDFCCNQFLYCFFSFVFVLPRLGFKRSMAYSAGEWKDGFSFVFFSFLAYLMTLFFLFFQMLGGFFPDREK